MTVHTTQSFLWVSLFCSFLLMQCQCQSATSIELEARIKISSYDLEHKEEQSKLPKEALVGEKPVVLEQTETASQDGGSGSEALPEKPFCPEDNVFCEPYSRFIFLQHMNLCDGKPCTREIGEVTLHPEGVLFSVTEEYQAFNRTTKGIMVTWEGNVRFSYTYNLFQMMNLFGFTHITLNKEPESFLSIAIQPADHHQRHLRAVAKRSIKTGEIYQGWSNFRISTAFRPAVDEEKSQIIVIEQSQKLASFSLENGKRRWDIAHNSNWACSPVIDRQSRIFVCDEQGYLSCFSDQGKLLWKQFFLADLPIKMLSFQQTYIGLNYTGYVYITDSYYTKVYTSQGILVLKMEKRMDKKFVVTSKSTMLFGSGPFLYSVDSQTNAVPKQVAQILFGQIPFHPILFVDNSILFQHSSTGLYRYAQDGTLLTRFPQKQGSYYYLRLPEPRQLFLPGGMGMVIKDDGTVYARAHYATSSKSSDEYVGILEIRLGLPQLDKEGWPTVNGLFSNKRSFK